MLTYVTIAVVFAVAGFVTGFYVAKRNPKLVGQVPNKVP